MSDSRVQSSPGGGQWGAARPAQAAEIELHIEAVIVYGLPLEDGAHMGEALQHELARLLGEGGLAAGLAHGGNILRLDGGAVSLAAGTTAEAIGVQVAQSVYQSFDGQGHP